MFQSLEDALVLAIKAAYPEFKTVAGYSGELSAEDLAKLLPALPACYVVIDGSPIGNPENALLAFAPQISTLVCTGSRRSRDDSRSAAYAACEALIDNLTGTKLDPGMTPLIPTGFDLVFVDNAVTVHGLRWKTDFDHAIEEE